MLTRRKFFGIMAGIAAAIGFSKKEVFGKDTLPEYPLHFDGLSRVEMVEKCPHVLGDGPHYIARLRPNAPDGEGVAFCVYDDFGKPLACTTFLSDEWGKLGMTIEHDERGRFFWLGTGPYPVGAVVGYSILGTHQDRIEKVIAYREHNSPYQRIVMDSDNTWRWEL